MKKKILAFSLITSLILGAGMVYAYKGLTQIVEGEVVEISDLNYEDFFEMGKQFLGNNEDTSPKELSSTYKQFNVNRYNALVTQFIRIDGLEVDEAKKRATENIIQEVALTQAAQDKGIIVTDAEALEMAKEARNLLENPKENTYGIDINAVNKFIEGLGMTEDEYWNEFVIDGYKQQLLQAKLKNDVIKDVDSKEAEKVWANFKETTTNEYKRKYSIEIQEFKKEAGVNY